MEAIDSILETAETVVDRLRPGMPEQLDRMTRRLFDEIPMYTSGAAGDFAAVRESVAGNCEDAFDRIRGRIHDLTTAVTIGRQRANQGVPLADLLTAFRFGYEDVWRALIDVSRMDPALPDDAMVDLSHRWFKLHNTVGDTLIHAYRDEAQHLLLSRERERAALIDVLLSHDVGLATMVEVAEMLRLPMEGSFVVAVAASRLGQDPIPRIDSYLSAVDVPSVWYLKQDNLIGLLSLGQPGRNATALDVLGRHASGPIGVSPVFGALRRASWGLGLARLVLERHSGGKTVEQFQDDPMNVLVASSPDAAQETSRIVLGGLLALPAERRVLLLRTFNTWVESGGSARQTGELLSCHPNTIRHRLRRIELTTGRSLGHPGDVAELVAACRAWSQLPSSVRDGAGD